jgi:hypothetical protein
MFAIFARSCSEKMVDIISRAAVVATAAVWRIRSRVESSTVAPLIEIKVEALLHILVRIERGSHPAYELAELVSHASEVRGVRQP